MHHKRKKIRLPDYDYSRPGAYFITVCTKNDECLFGEIVRDEVRLNQYGQIVSDEWIRTAQIHTFVELDAYIVMPDHFHGIIIIKDTGTGRGSQANAFEWCRGRAPTAERFGRPVAGSLPTIIRSFKSAVTRRINTLRGTPGNPVWQRGYYEHVIRYNEKINLVREYILNNPLRWSMGGKKNNLPDKGLFDR